MAEMYLKLNGIDGDSTAKGYEKQIELSTYSFSVSQASNAPHTSAGSHADNRATFSDFNFGKLLDVASPTLFQYCATGKVIPDATLTLCRPNEKQTVYQVIKFKKLIVSSYAPGGSAGMGTPTESISLRFSEMTMQYTQIKDDGSEGAKPTGGWNLATNEKASF
ncbi:MAG: type VI secretion system tube protein Hcp [Planctomycetota bacterium]|nr:type VI secretion system tube protein Hcp [Planctomycetota bacterium]